MSTVKDYLPEEWTAIAGAPAAAGLLISLADPSGLIGSAKEGMAVARAITEGIDDSSPEVLRSLADEVKAGHLRPELPSLPFTDRDKARAVLMERIKAAVAAVEAKSPSEVVGVKTWIVATATRVAQASREGGFLGFGGVAVSDDERAAIDALALTLGVDA